MGTDDSERAMAEAERAAKDLKEQMNRARRVVAEARERLTGQRPMALPKDKRH